MGKCIIVGAGDFFETNIPISQGDFLIAADGGLNYLKELEIHPNLVMGDMDSVKVDYKEENHRIFPSKKDDSDTLIAINEGLKLGYELFFIFGGMGGRIDHTLANIKI
ncbi:MAG: thiamine diphosphokinase, partial [Oscillospiraceae bacterium]